MPADLLVAFAALGCAKDFSEFLSCRNVSKQNHTASVRIKGTKEEKGYSQGSSLIRASSARLTFAQEIEIR
jgi:hypothetical protein